MTARSIPGVEGREKTEDLIVGVGLDGPGVDARRMSVSATPAATTALVVVAVDGGSCVVPAQPRAATRTNGLRCRIMTRTPSVRSMQKECSRRMAQRMQAPRLTCGSRPSSSSPSCCRSACSSPFTSSAASRSRIESRTGTAPSRSSCRRSSLLRRAYAPDGLGNRWFASVLAYVVALAFAMTWR